MAKKGSNKKGHNLPQGSITLREESTGKRQSNVSAKSLLKLQHIKKLANWASCEASVPSLGAFFGHRLAECAEALGTPADPSLFTCQSCESILQPGCNCTIRVEKNRGKVKGRRKNSKFTSQNNVVYTCHFCSHRNLVRGTPRGHMKELYPPKPKARPATKALPKTATADSLVNANAANKKGEAAPVKNNMDSVKAAATDVLKHDQDGNTPATPLVKVGPTLLEARSKKRSRSKPKKATESESSSTGVDAEKTVSGKRRRKTWTSLKEKAESSEHVNRRNLTNLAIPFLM